MTANLVDLGTRATFARVKALEVDGADLVALLKTGGTKAVQFQGMPQDAVAVGIRTLPFAVGKLVLLVESNEFPLIDVSEGAVLPSLDVKAGTIALRLLCVSCKNPAALNEDGLCNPCADEEARCDALDRMRD